MVHVGNQVYTAMALNGPPEWLTVYEVYGDDEEWCQLLVSVTHPMIHPPSLYEPSRRAQDTSGKLYRNVPTNRVQQLLDSEGSGRRAHEEPEEDGEEGLCAKSAQCDRLAGHAGRCNKKRRSEEQAPPPYTGWGAVTTRVVVTTKKTVFVPGSKLAPSVIVRQAPCECHRFESRLDPPPRPARFRPSSRPSLTPSPASFWQGCVCEDLEDEFKTVDGEGGDTEYLARLRATLEKSLSCEGFDIKIV